MKVLVFDVGRCGLGFALHAQAWGHDVRLWSPPMPGTGRRSPIGEGLIERPLHWEPSFRWADLIFCTDNTHFHSDLTPYFRRGFPILGPTREQADLELDRECGIRLLQECGVPTLPYEVFSNWKSAVDYVKATNERYVSKPWGGHPDKSLSYVSRSPADMVFKLEKWASEGGMKGKIILQKAVNGREMAVGVWLHRFGPCAMVNENWEEKRQMNDALGANTGEAGTIMRFVETSKLYDKILAPCIGRLVEMGYRGYVDFNSIIENDGTPQFLEATMRPGWPHFNLCLALWEGDPLPPLAALLEGKDEFRCRSDVCVGVVMAHGDWPHGNLAPEETEGYPLVGLPKVGAKSFWQTSTMECCAPVMRGGKVEMADTTCTAGDYVGIATGLGPTVEAARKAAYATAWKIDWPSNRLFRTDIGCRLKEGIHALQKYGYATGLRYE